MAIPVYINQEAAGALTVTRDGLYTVLETEAPHGGGLVRLWAHGGGKSAYLGVMEPQNGGLRLRRRLSRRRRGCCGIPGATGALPPLTGSAVSWPCPQSFARRTQGWSNG